GGFDEAQPPCNAGQTTCNEAQPPCCENPRWLFSDFKKKGGFKRSLEISKEYELYRQQYCGCVYSAKGKKLQTNKQNSN
ncbi:MAG: epoxyqueuosine reductase QueH, partial [Treponema sp.]|nr:epoxyqueuosine reductase QueH [Treponema sp.]